MAESHYLTAQEAAAYVRKTLKGFDHWVASEGIRCDGRAGRIRLFTRATLDRALKTAAMRPRVRRRVA